MALDPQDTASDPADAVPATDKEINIDRAVAIVGPLIQTAPVVMPLAAKANIPDLMWGGGAAFDNETSPYFFQLSPSDTEMSYAMMAYAHSRGWNKVALAIGNTTGDTSLVPGLKAEAQKLGMTIQRTVTIAVGSTSFRSEINNLFSGHPQAIVGQFDIPSAGVLFGELKQENLLSTPWVVSNLWFAKEFFSSVGASVATGPVYIANPGTENGGYNNFLTLLKQKTGQTQPSNGETFMYDAVNILLHVMLTYTTFGKAIRATSNNIDLARACGIDSDRVISLTWFIAGLLTAVAGVGLVLQESTLSPTTGFTELFVLFGAVILGGIGRPYGAMLGALIVGILTEVAGAYMNAAYKTSIAFGVVVILLLFRDQRRLARERRNGHRHPVPPRAHRRLAANREDPSGRGHRGPSYGVPPAR